MEKYVPQVINEMRSEINKSYAQRLINEKYDENMQMAYSDILMKIRKPCNSSFIKCSSKLNSLQKMN